MYTQVLLSGKPRGPSSGGTRWVMREADDWRGTLSGFDNTAERLRYCRWGEGADVTVAEPPADGTNASTTLACASAAKGRDFAGDVAVYVSLNGVDFAPTGLTFTYYRQPRITAYTPHGGPVACTQSAVEGGTGLPAGEAWDTAGAGNVPHLPTPACALQRNWRPHPTPSVRQVIAAGIGDGYSAGDTISIVLEQPAHPALQVCTCMACTRA